MSELIGENLIHCVVHGPGRCEEHHIIPSSRGGEGKDKGNVNERTCVLCHQYSHFHHANMTPPEIIRHYVNDLWSGQVRWVWIYLWQHLLEGLRTTLGMPPRKGKWGAATPQPLQNGRLHRSLEGERRLLGQLRELGLGAGDYIVVDERTKQVVRFARRGAGQRREDLLEENLKWFESIRPIAVTLLPD